MGTLLQFPIAKSRTASYGGPVVPVTRPGEIIAASDIPTDELKQRIIRIRASLEKINTLMAELRKQNMGGNKL